MLGPWAHKDVLRLNLESRVSRRPWFDCLELKLEWILCFVKGKVLDNIDIKDVLLLLLNLTVIVLVENHPIDVNRLYTSIFYHKSFGNWFRFSHNSWNGESWNHSVVVETNLVWWDSNWRPADRDAYWELDIRESLHFRENSIIKFTADIIVNCNRYRHLRVGWEVSHVWAKHDGETFVVTQVEALLLL